MNSWGTLNAVVGNSADWNCFGAHLAGDTVDRLAFGCYSGQGYVGFGAGGASARDTFIMRNAAAAGLSIIGGTVNFFDETDSVPAAEDGSSVYLYRDSVAPDTDSYFKWGIDQYQQGLLSYTGGAATWQGLFITSNNDIDIASDSIVTLNPLTTAVIGDGSADVDYIFKFDGQTSDGLITWMEDEDYFQFGDDVVFDEQISANNIAVGTVSPSASFSGAGDIYATSGIKAMEGLNAEAVAYGAGLEIQDNGLVVTYTNAAYGDATLTAATQLITDSHGSFDSTYVGQYFKCIGATPDYTGATGQIIAVPSGTTLIISFGTAGGDTIVDATAMSFVIYPAPRFFVGDNGDFLASVGVHEDASFKVQCGVSNNDHAAHLDVTAGKDNNCGLTIEYDPDTYGGTSATCVSYDATAFAAADTVGTVHNVIVDNIGVTAGDVHAIDVALTDPSNTDLEVEALATHEGIDPVAQYLGDPAALDSAWSYDTDTFNDRTTAFNNAGTDVQIFVSDNDYILLASTSKWDEINAVNATDSSHTIVPTFHYIEDDGDWIAFTPADDSNGFSQSGTIRFDSDNLTTWGQRTVNEVTGQAGAVDYYWIKITRTRNVLPTPPTEDTIKITTLGTKFNGVLMER